MQNLASMTRTGNRILAIDFENKNASICDYIVDFNTYDEAVEKICGILKI